MNIATAKTDRPAELAGTAGRPVNTNTLEETSMSSEKGSALLGRANNPSGLTGELPSYDELLAWAAARNAEFEHAPYCDHPYNGPHPCMSEVDAMLPGVRFSNRQTSAVVYATAWSEEETREPTVFVVFEKPLVDDVPPDDVLAETWLTPSTARAFAAQLLESARIAEAEQAAIDASDATVTELGVLCRRVDAGDFATMDEVGAALRRIVGVQ